VRAEEVKPGELVGTNKDSYIMLVTIPLNGSCKRILRSIL